MAAKKNNSRTRRSKKTEPVLGPPPKQYDSCLLISLKDNQLVIETLVLRRARVHGMKTFFENYHPQEVLISEEARKVLLSNPDPTEFCAIEFFDHNEIAWFGAAYKAQAPLSQVRIEGKKAQAAIKKFRSLG